MNYKPLKIFFLVICTIVFIVAALSSHPRLSAGETAAVKFMEKEVIGKYLADFNGITLYSYAKDGPDVSNCIEGCAANWPPFYEDISAVGEGLEANDFGIITRSDSRRQVTFRGKPLYYFINDKFPGDTFGQGIGDVWFLVIP